MIIIRHLRLRSITSTTIYGADLDFARGLNVIYAGNTSGKSTCLQAIIYALGLERSLGPQLDIPLPYAMRERIHQHIDEEYAPVLQSYVELEIENSDGAVLTIHRDVVGGADTKLIKTWNVARLTESDASGQERDFFVHDAGAAIREDGFHSQLAKFIGWTLPQVLRFDGTEGPLYLEAIFPMLFVEQKRGWSAVQGPFPTFLRIQDVARRVMEFLLNLEAARIRRERAEIRRMLATNQQKWSDARTRLEERAGRLIRFRGLPITPNAEFAHLPSIELEVFSADEWQSIDTVTETLTSRLALIENEIVPRTDDVAPQVEAQLDTAQARADEISAALEPLRDDYNTEAEEYRAIEQRVKALEIDLRRNEDASKLKRLGSELGHASGDAGLPYLPSGNIE